MPHVSYEASDKAPRVIKCDAPSRIFKIQSGKSLFSLLNIAFSGKNMIRPMTVTGKINPVTGRKNTGFVI